MAAESDVLCEIEVLQSIYLDDLMVTRNQEGGWRVRVILHPSTGEDCLAQFVRLTLTLDLDSEYPVSPPCISIHHPRGLSDDKLLSLQCSLRSEAEECVGTPVLYQLIQKAKEILTESNIPHGNCVICLYGFKEGEVFTKTSCYHYFHSHCLGRYITHSEEELQERVRELKEDKTRDRGEDEELCVVCPVCRETLRYDLDTLLSSPLPNYPEKEDDSVTAEFKRRWAGLQKILERQRERGGVIDPEAESNRFLIHINHASAESLDSTCADTSDPDPTQPLHPPPPPPPPPPECSNQNPRPPHTESNPCPSHRRAPRRQQVEFRGVRRGGGRGGGGRGAQGGHGAQWVPPPVLESIAKLHVSAAESSGNAGAPQDTDDHQDRCSTHVEERPSGDEGVESSRRETTLGQHVASEASHLRTREPGARQEAHRGRRHGPRATSYGHWRERNAQWDNGGNVHHHRGARGHRGAHHRGHGKNWHPRPESEFRKEGVL